MLKKSLLQFFSVPCVHGQPFNGDDDCILDLRQGHKARTGQLAVDQDAAGAAVAGVAAGLGALQGEFVAENIAQPFARGGSG